MKPLILIPLLLVAVAVLPGCFKADVRLPRGLDFGAPPSYSEVPRADPDDKMGLLRENRQLNERAVWLDKRIRKLAGEHAELENEQLKIQNEMVKLASERDRYLRAAGR